MSVKNFYIQLETPPNERLSPLSDDEIKTLLDQYNPIPGTWKQLLKKGIWGKHPSYGDIVFSPQNLDEIHDNIKNNTIGRAISFNYNHHGKSMALSTILDVRKVLDASGQTEKLEYLPEYTPTGYKLVKGGEYKYGSVEYQENFKDKGMAITNVAATNDPFLTGDGITQLSCSPEEKKYRKLEDIIASLQDIHSELKTHPDLYRKQGSPQLRSLFGMALKNIQSCLPNELENDSGEAKNLDIKEAETMPTELEKITQELQAVKAQIVKLEAEKTAEKVKLEAEKKELSNQASDEVKKLQADNLKLVQEVGKAKLESWETRMLSKGHMKPAIEKVKEEAVKGGYSTTIKLSNDYNVDFLDYSEKLIDLACPENARVNLSQEPNSGTWVKLEAGKDNSQQENPLVADAKARAERGK